MRKAFALLVLCLAPLSGLGYPNGSMPSGANPNDAYAAYAQFKSARFTSSGTGNPSTMLRVKGDGGNTVSEGMGYGMLMAAYLDNDPNVVKKLWNYVASHLDAKGLMHWKIDANNKVIGHNAASDGDVDIALALVKAHTRWPTWGFGNLGKTYINRILQHETDASGLKPGDVWGGINGQNNPSYYATSYFPVFKAFTGNAAWDTVRDRCYQNLQYSYYTYALVPEWTSGSTGKIYGPDEYTYNACRTPWRLALDYLWFGDPRGKAWSIKFSKFFHNKGGVPAIRNGYKASTGQPIVSYKTVTFVGAVGCAAMAAGYTTLMNDVYTYTKNAYAPGYYDGALKVLYLMVMTGIFKNPLGGGASTTTTTYEAESMYHSTGGAYPGGWNIWSNGYISKSHSFNGGSVTLQVIAAGTYAAGAWPKMVVSVGGTTVGQVSVASAGWTTYTFNFSTSAGTKEIRVAFTNDYYDGTNDRNLMVDKIKVGD